MPGVLQKLLGVDATRVDTVQKHELGIEIDFADGRRRKYIRAGGAIAVNDALKVDVAEGPHDFIPTAAANDALAGVAEVAIADNSFGWVVVRGAVVSKAAATVVAGAHAVPTGTAGTLDDSTAAAANAIALAAGIGAIFQTTTSGGLATVILN